MPKDLRDEQEDFANKAGNVCYEDLPTGVQDGLWRMFLEAVAPLKTAGKLGNFLLQCHRGAH